jgi:hypothetical protein
MCAISGTRENVLLEPNMVGTAPSLHFISSMHGCWMASGRRWPSAQADTGRPGANKLSVPCACVALPVLAESLALGTAAAVHGSCLNLV